MKCKGVLIVNCNGDQPLVSLPATLKGQETTGVDSPFGSHNVTRVLRKLISGWQEGTGGENRKIWNVSQ